MKKYFIILGLYFLLALVATRGLILNPGTIGHNWDWLIPSRDDYLKNLFFNSFSTWQNSNLGESRIFQLPSLPFMILLLAPSLFGLGGDFISKYLVILTIIFSGMGMFLFLKNILSLNKSDKKNIFAPFLGGFFYAFSPFLYADFIGGATTQFFAYSLLPWFIFFVNKLNQNRSRFWLFLLLSSSVLSLLTISLQVLFLSSLITFLYILIQKNKKVYFLNLIFIYMTYMIFNLYWIIPTIGESLNIKETVFSDNFFDTTNIKISVPELWEIFIGTGYWRPLFVFSISLKLFKVWLSVSYLLILIVLAVNLLIKKHKESFFWFFTLIIAFIFSTGGKAPMGDQVLWLYLHFPLMALFRSPQHLLVVPTLSLAILLGLSGNFFKKYLKLKIIMLVGVIVWVYPFFLHGDIGSEYLRIRKKDHLDLVRLSPGYNQIFDYLKNQKPGDFRILFLPLSSSPRYLKTDYQFEAQGGDPLVIYSPYGTVVSDINYNPYNKKLAQFVEELIYEKKQAEYLDEILSMLKIKYLIIRNDVLPEFSDNKKIWEFRKIKDYILKNENFKKIYEFEDVELIENAAILENKIIDLSNQPIITFNNEQTIINSLLLKNFSHKDNILVTGNMETLFKNSPSGSKVFLNLIPYEPKPFKIDDKNVFNFNLSQAGDFEILVKRDDFSENFKTNPLNPLKFKIDDKFLIKEIKKSSKDYNSYGFLNLEKGDHRLEIILPDRKNLLENPSFESGLWGSTYDASIILEEEENAIQIKSKKDSIGFARQEISGIKPDAVYKISFVGKTIEGDPAHFSIFQDTDILQDNKPYPKVDHYLEKKNYYTHFDSLLKTNIDTKKAYLEIYADIPDNGTTKVIYDRFNISQLFTSPVILKNDPTTNTSLELPQYDYSCVSKTRCEINIQKSKGNYYLTFNESFNNNWKIYLFEKGEKIGRLNLLVRNTPSEKTHFIGNLYANSWLIKKTGDYKIVIDYFPQQLFYLGSLFSAASFFLLLFLSLKQLFYLRGKEV